MAKQFLLGLDVGGGSGRALLVDVSSGAVFSAMSPWTHLSASGSGGWALDMDLETNWQKLASATREVLVKAGARAEEVVAISATSFRFGLVLLGQNQEVLMSVPNRDVRSLSGAAELADRMGPDLYRRTGKWPLPIMPAARLLSLRGDNPHLFEAAKHCLSVGDWLHFRLSGELATDFTHACESMFLELGANQWSDELMEAMGLSRALFPKLIRAGSRLGALTEKAAQDFGLTAGTPVYQGAADTACAVLGMGVTEPGQLAIASGTTTAVVLVSNSTVNDSQKRIWVGQHIIPGRYLLESNAGMAGDSLELLANTLFENEPFPVAHFFSEAQKSMPGAGGALSSFAAEVMHASQMQMPYGHMAMGSLRRPGETSRRPEFTRSVIEGMAYAVRANAEQLQQLMLCERKEFFVAGGLSQSPLWSQILSNVLSGTAQVGVRDASAFGAALCAGVGAGVYKDFVQAAEAAAKHHKSVAPHAEDCGTYQRLYKVWQKWNHEMAAPLVVGMNHALEHVDNGTDVAPTAALFRPKILVTAEFDEDSLAALRKIGDVTYKNFRASFRPLMGDDLVEALQGFHVFVTEVDTIDAEALKRLPDLRVVFSCRGNAVNVDTEACSTAGVPVLNAPGRNADAVADLTVAFALMLLRKLGPATRFLKDSQIEAGEIGRMGQAFSELQGHELWQQTVGLVGFGAVARKVAQRLRPFGASVIAYDPFLSAQDVLAAGCEPVTLDELLTRSDVVSLHASVDTGSKGLLGRPQLAKMKKGAALINTARAALVEEEALIEALKSGHLGGAALDVFWVEPPASTHPLLQMPNVIAAPHVGGNTVEVATHQGRMVVEELTRLLAGQPVRTAQNPKTLSRFRWTEARSDDAQKALEALGDRPAPSVTDVDAEPSKSKPSLHLVTPPTPVSIALASPAPLATPKDGLLSRIWASMGFGKKAAPPLQAKKSHKMDQVVAAFLQRIIVDDALKKFSNGRKVTVHYTLTDLDMQFYFGFHDGAVTASMGSPAAPAEIRLKMRAEIMDKTLNKEMNPARAAMTGKMSFAGDTRTALTLQRIQDDFCRIYIDARTAVGGPGDLSDLGTSAAASGTATAPAPAGSDDLREELVHAVKELYAMGVVTSTGGNISVRIPGTDEAWITPSALHKGSLKGSDMVRIKLNGQPVDDNAKSPSSERLFHCAVLRARPDVEAVVHAHAPKATALALANLPFLPVNTEAAFFGDLPRVPFIMPGTQELADAIVEKLGQGAAVLLQNHGLLVAASSLRRGADMVEIIERSSQLIVDCYSMGKVPPVLPDEVVSSLREAGRLVA